MAGFRKLIIVATAAAALAGASAASAQPVPPPPPLAPPAANDSPVDPAKLAIARRLLDMQMSQMNLPGVIKSMDRQMFDQVMKQSPNGDPAMQRRVEAAVEKAQDEMMPKIMDGMAAFARNLSQKELDDSVAFYSSPSGQAILHKMPAIMGDVIGSLGEWMPRMRQAVIDGICDNNGCTPAQREAMEHPQPPGPPPPR